MAHIGAIEELVERDYEITSIAGCSIGSLIGGIYASGKLEEAHEWFCSLDKQQILSLTDFSLGLSHMVKGDKVLQAIQEFVPDRPIEMLPIPLTIVATDIINAEEVVFREGSLFEAIRASISIPLFFRPVKYKDTLLVDGGLINPFPLDRVPRLEDDILVGVNISAQDKMDIRVNRELPQLPQLPVITQVPEKLQRLQPLVDRWDQLVDKWDQLAEKVDSMAQEHDEERLSAQVNYLSLVNRSIDVQIQRAGQMMTKFYHPDVLVEMPQYEYTTFDFDKAEEILQRGRESMRAALDAYEALNP